MRQTRVAHAALAGAHAGRRCGVIRATTVERELTDNLPGHPETGECSYRPVCLLRNIPQPAMNVGLLDGNTLTNRVADRCAWPDDELIGTEWTTKS